MTDDLRHEPEHDSSLKARWSSPSRSDLGSLLDAEAGAGEHSDGHDNNS